MRRLGSLIAVAASLGMHLGLLAALGTTHYSTQQGPPEPAIEATFSDARLPENFPGLLIPATTLVSTNRLVTELIADSVDTFGSRQAAAWQAARARSQAPISAEESNTATARPDQMIDVGIVYDDGGPPEVSFVTIDDGLAFDCISMELIRFVRQPQSVLVVWLFDESASMQALDLSRQMRKLYEDLETATSAARTESANGGPRRRMSGDLQTAITSFGEKFTTHTPQPTSNVAEIRAAVDKIPVDESGIENFCLAINSALDKYGPLARDTQRRLVLVLVTDESGDDGEQIEATLEKCRRFEAAVYVLGHEAIFGSPDARTRWQDPRLGLEHWLPVRRGPETPFLEALQWDGLQARCDMTPSGFGPFEQIRLALHAGGVFLVLPVEEQPGAERRPTKHRRYDPFDMREYVPESRSREDYQRERDASVFRSAVWDTIVRLDPHRHPELIIQQSHYPIDRQAFAKASQQPFERAIAAMQALEATIAALDKVRALRDQEASMRWRANYDLILAQCLAYRVRLDQFCLALDQHQRNFPAPAAPQHNAWNVEHVPQMLPADPRVTQLKGIDLELLANQEQQARKMFEFVQTAHPGTPWAVRAADELAKGFGFRFVSRFRDPRYDDLDATAFPRQ